MTMQIQFHILFYLLNIHVSNISQNDRIPRSYLMAQVPYNYV